MTAAEILLFNREMICRLLDSGIRPEDARHLDIYLEYRSMTGAGFKPSYSVAHLADKYGVSVRFIYSLLSRLKKDCTVCTR